MGPSPRPTPAAASDCPPAAEIRVLEPGHLEDLAAVWDAVWPGEGGWAAIMSAGTPGLLRALVAYDAGRPVASGYIILDPRKTFAYLGGGAVVESQRSRGLYRALLAERARIAAAAGTANLVVEASPASAPILARLGFRTLTTLRHFQRRFG